MSPVSSLASTYDNTESGYWLVWFQRDGRVVRYVEEDSIIEAIGADRLVEKEPMDATDIEIWVHDEIVGDRPIELYPRVQVV